MEICFGLRTKTSVGAKYIQWLGIKPLDVVKISTSLFVTMKKHGRRSLSYSCLGMLWSGDKVG
jgi:hypothetical protein